MNGGPAAEKGGGGGGSNYQLWSGLSGEIGGRKTALVLAVEKMLCENRRQFLDDERWQGRWPQLGPSRPAARRRETASRWAADRGSVFFLVYQSVIISIYVNLPVASGNI